MPRRRNKRTPRLSVDLWGHVVLNLFTCPRKVFMMLCAVKGLQFNDEWWDKYWERHRRYNAARNRTTIFTAWNPLGLEWPRPCSDGMFCSRCGCRFHHSIFRMRLCRECVRDGHVSNTVPRVRAGPGAHPVEIPTLCEISVQGRLQVCKRLSASEPQPPGHKLRRKAETGILLAWRFYSI